MSQDGELMLVGLARRFGRRVTEARRAREGRRQSLNRASSRFRSRIEPLEPRVMFDAGDFDVSFAGDGIASFLIQAGAVKTTDVVVDERDNSAIIVGNTTIGSQDLVLLRVA